MSYDFPLTPAYGLWNVITNNKTVIGIFINTVYEVDNVFPPDDLWFGSDTYTYCAGLYNLFSDVWMVLVGARVASCGLPFPDTGYTVPNLRYIYLLFEI